MNFALGQAIRQAREKRGMSLRALARAIGVSAPFLSDVEHGRRNINDLAAVAKVLKVSLEELRVLESRVDVGLKLWIERNPGLVVLLRTTRERCRHQGGCFLPRGPNKVRLVP